MKAEQQLNIDWTRAQQLGMLDRLVIPKPGPGDEKVSAATCKHVLRVIDSFGRGGVAWPSCETIAAQACSSVRAVKRATSRLRQIGILAVDKRGNQNGSVSNCYSVVWTELAVLETRILPPERGATNDKRGATLSDRGATNDERGATMALKPLEAHEALEPPGDPAAAELLNLPKENPELAEITSALRAINVDLSNEVAQSAFAAGWKPEQVRDAINTAQANQKLFRRWKGALVYYLKHRKWTCEATDMVMVPTEAQKRDREQRRAQGRIEAAAIAMNESQSQNELENVWGRRFDSLSQSRRDRVIGAVIAINPTLQTIFERDASSVLVRDLCLLHLRDSGVEYDVQRGTGVNVVGQAGQYKCDPKCLGPPGDGARPARRAHRALF